MKHSMPALRRWTETPTRMPCHVSANTIQSRTDWIDAARGIGIVLVVFGHSIGGLRDAGIVPKDGALSAVFYMIYTFHMPLFFLLSGVFVETRLAHRRADFVQGAFTRIAWPYLLWSVIQLAVINSLGNLVNAPTAFDIKRYVALLWQPTSQFWYLYVLLLLLIVSYFVVPRVGPEGLLVLSLFVHPLHELYSLSGPLANLCWFGLFYALGVVLGSKLVRLQAGTTTAVLVAVGAALFWLVCGNDARTARYAYWSDATIPAAIAGTVACLAMANIPQLAHNRFLVLLGRRSLAIFLLHVLFVAGTRIVLQKMFGLAEPAPILLLVVIAGVVGPLLVRALVARLNLLRPLGLS
jgi:fucose 4-O-acetylase-like acetyltransferase